MNYLSIGEQSIPVLDELGQIQMRDGIGSMRWLWLSLAFVLVVFGVFVLFNHLQE